MQELFFRTQDGTNLRYARFRAPRDAPRGTVLCLHGRRECLEIYLELFLEFNDRGFDVVSFDWRGQGGSDRPLPDRHKHHILSFDPYRLDAQEFYDKVVKPEQRGPLLVYGHSMGGFVGLDWLITDSPPLVGALLAAPMLALPAPSWLYGSLLQLSHATIQLGGSESYTHGESQFDPRQWQFAGNLLTHDPERYQLIPRLFAARPELALGGVTYGWAHAALEAIIRVRARLQEVQTPVLIMNSGQDQIVRADELSYWAQHIPHATEKVYPKALHCLMLETDDLRAAAWRDMDAFLAKVLPK